MILLVQHRVRDYDAWKRVFDEHGPVRKRHGATRHWVLRSQDNPNETVVAVQFPSPAVAQAFGADPSLREAMERAGVQGEPTIRMLEEVEEVAY